MAQAVVIGGGVMGLAAARALRQRGHSVTLLERGQPGRAASWASAGIVGATLRDESDPSFQLRRLSRSLWPDLADALHSESGLDPEYREMGCLQLAADDAEVAVLQRAAASATPEDRAQYLDRRQLHELEPALSAEIPGGLSVAGGNVDPRRLCRALELSVRRAGVRLETGVDVRAVLQARQTVTAVAAAQGQFPADVVVLAAGAWSASIDQVSPRPPVSPQRGQILALDHSRVGIRHVLLTTGDPYFVPRCDGRLVVGATREEAGWDPSLTAGGVAWLLNRAMQIVPALATCPIAEMWTGFRPASADGRPLIGQSKLDGLYFLTGHGPSGIAPLPGSIALLMALMHDEPTPVPPQPFDPRRFEPAPLKR